MREGERLCWVITGAGHFLREVTGLLEELSAHDRKPLVDLFFTRAAREVAARYGVRERLEASAARFFCEGDYSAGQSIYFFSGLYRALVVAPATANTTAKCALGIADSLASNFFAQAGKSGVPTLLLPTDGEDAVDSVTPSGRTIRVTPRPVDIQWTRALRDGARFPNVTVAPSIAALTSALAPHISS